MKNVCGTPAAQSDLINENDFNDFNEKKKREKEKQQITFGSNSKTVS